MLISQSELFPLPSQITIEINSVAVAGAKTFNITTTRDDDFICEYGESESAGTTLGSFRHYLQIESIDVYTAQDLTTLCGATVKIKMPEKTIIFSDCKTYKIKTTIVGDQECVSEICLISPKKTIRGGTEYDG